METHPPFSPRNFSFFFLGHFHESLKTTCYFLLPSLSPLPTIHVQKHLQVLNWDVVQAVTPPVEQIILSTDKVKIEINNNKRGARGEKSTTCCFCCDSASPPKQNSSDGQKPKSSLKAGPSASRINSTTGAGSSTSKGARSSSPKGARSSSTKGAGSSSGR